MAGTAVIAGMRDITGITGMRDGLCVHPYPIKFPKPTMYPLELSTTNRYSEKGEDEMEKFEIGLQQPTTSRTTYSARRPLS